MANSSSTCPFPSTPATPTTSPARIVNASILSRPARSESISTTARPSLAGRDLRTGGNSVPTISWARLARVRCTHRRSRADDDAVAHHGNAIGGLDDLAQAVGDEHDRPAFGRPGAE